MPMYAESGSIHLFETSECEGLLMMEIDINELDNNSDGTAMPKYTPKRPKQ